MVNFGKLQELEIKIRKSYYSANNSMLWMSSKTKDNYLKKWNKYMSELRGWYDSNGEEFNTKSSWLKYCSDNNINPNYSFFDILA